MSAISNCRYKNRLYQQAGINEEVLKWMAAEAEHHNVPVKGKAGGLVFDEMAIQEC